MSFLKQLLITISILVIGANAFAAGLKKDSIIMIDNNYAVISSPSPIDISYNDDVQKISELYQNNDFAKIKNMVVRGKDWFPMMEQIFTEEGLPTELKYLAFIESGFNCRVYSRAGARGMWQFMRFTGIHYGLKVNRAVDERTDPQKATRAAAQYFKKLFAQYNDWQMVAAAYNCGEGMLDAAIEKANGSTDFWEVYKYLPRETRKYVPHFLGIVDAMNSFTAQAELKDYLQNNGVNAEKNNAQNVGMLTASVSSDIKPVENYSTDIKSVKVATASTSSAVSDESIYKKEYFVYIIKAGDSMESISKMFPKNTIGMIKNNNNISSNAEINRGSTLLLEK